MLRRNFTELLFSLAFLGFVKKEDGIEDVFDNILIGHERLCNFSKYNNSIIRVFSQKDELEILNYWFIGDRSGVLPISWHTPPKYYNLCVGSYSRNYSNRKDLPYVYSNLSNINKNIIKIGCFIKKQNPNTKILVRLIKDSSTKIQDDFIEV